MKGFLKLFCISLMISFFYCGCGQKKTEHTISQKFDSDLEYIMDKKNIIIGVTDFKPLDYLENAKWIGFDADFATLFAENLGVCVTFLEIDWDKKVELLNDGTIDCIWNGMTLSEEVKNAMSYSISYLNNAQMVVVPKKNAEGLQTIEDCMHFLFAVESGSTGALELKERNYRYIQADSQMEALSNVNSEKADAAVIDAIMAGALIGSGKQFEELLCIDSVGVEEYVVGFRKDSDVTEKFNTFWKEQYENGTIKEIAEKYEVQEMLIKP